LSPPESQKEAKLFIAKCGSPQHKIPQNSPPPLLEKNGSECAHCGRFPWYRESGIYLVPWYRVLWNILMAGKWQPMGTPESKRRADKLGSLLTQVRQKAAKKEP